MKIDRNFGLEEGDERKDEQGPEPAGAQPGTPAGAKPGTPAGAPPRSPAAGPGRPPAGQPTPTRPLPDPTTRETKFDTKPEPRAQRPARRRRAERGAATPRKEKSRSVEEGGVPFLFAPGFLLLVGAVVLAVLWAGGLFVASPEGWPWESFRGEGGEGWTFGWTPTHVLTVVGAALTLFVLVAALFPSTRGRGASLLVVAGLGLVLLSPHVTGETYLLFLGAGFLGVAGGTVIAKGGWGGGRGLALIAVLLLAAVLFFPHVTTGTEYQSTAWDLGQQLVGGEDQPSFGEVIQRPNSALILMLCVLLALALLVWLGAGGGWTVWVGGLALLIGVAAPLVLAYLKVTPAEGESLACQAAMQGVASGVAAVGALLAFALPIAAGVVDLARPRQD